MDTSKTPNKPTSGGGGRFAGLVDSTSDGGPSRQIPRGFGSGGYGSRGGGMPSSTYTSKHFNQGSNGRPYGIDGGGGYAQNPRVANWGPSASGGYSQHPKVEEDGTWHRRGGRPAAREREMEIFKSTKDKTTGINFDSYDAIEVEVTGVGSETITPLVSFRAAAGISIPPALMENIIRVRYDKPTPVQKHAIPILLADRDLMACAQTGSGKTAAFLFPMIIKMLTEGPPPSTPALLERDVAHPVGLVLSPTRELTCQIYEEARKFAFKSGIRTVVVYGGAELRVQLGDLRRGCDICVATPGRLSDILERRLLSLSQVKYLVLDEADRMLDMGFAPQIHEIVETKNMPTSAMGRRTAMFSATFPKEIQLLAGAFLVNYLYLTVGRVGSTNEFITQKLVYAQESDKAKGLLQLLKEAKGRVLVFVETRKKADALECYLNDHDIHATSIHGDRSQMERTKALDMFKRGLCPVLVATDVAARGLDIHSITWVINLDLPHNIEDYVHRIGRTGRAGNAGLATSFVNELNRPVLRELHRLLEEANQEVPSWFISLTRACTSANTRGFGQSRYGGGGGGSRGGRGNFGGVDYRYNDSNRRGGGFNSMSSPRGGNGPQHNSNRHTDMGAGEQSYTRVNNNDDCW